jgi:hypothetical protein
LDEHGNRGCKVGYFKVIADSVPLVGNRVGIVKSMHKRKGDVITSFRTQGTSKVTIPPRTVSETGQKNGITLELAYCTHDYAIITLLDGAFQHIAATDHTTRALVTRRKDYLQAMTALMMNETKNLHQRSARPLTSLLKR